MHTSKPTVALPSGSSGYTSMAAVRSIIATIPGVDSTETPIVPPTSVSSGPSTVNSCSFVMPGASDMSHASYPRAMYDDRHNQLGGRAPMPMIEVTAPAGAIPPEGRDELLEELAGTLLRWEGAPDTEF